jgi:hypothetical protein
MGRWSKGQSGNPKGRPRDGASIAGRARSQVERYKLIEKLGEIGARAGEYAKVGVDQQIRAIQLLLSYGYGPPRSEVERGDAAVIQVTYVERNQFAIDGAAPSATADNGTSEALQRRLLRAALGQDSTGDRSADPRGAEG